MPTHSAPSFLGRAVGLLFFDEDRKYKAALKLLINSEPFIQYGEKVQPISPGVYGETRFVRYAEKNSDVFSTVQDGAVQPPWEPAEPVHYAEIIDKDLTDHSWRVFEETYSTPACDPMFMEGEAGLGWYDRSKGRLELVMGTQSPHSDGEFSAAAVAKYSGSNASEITMGVTADFEIVKLLSSSPKDQRELEEKALSPQWTPMISSGSAASTSAFNQMHPLMQAARLVFLEGLWPAAVGQHLCRCTGYVKYYQAIKDVILNTPGLTVPELSAKLAATTKRQHNG